jgi:hypothetical protein
MFSEGSLKYINSCSKPHTRGQGTLKGENQEDAARMALCGLNCLALLELKRAEEAVVILQQGATDETRMEHGSKY